MGRDIKNPMSPQLLEVLEHLAHMYAGRAPPDATGASATGDAPTAAPPVENLQAFFEGLTSTQLKAVTLSIDGNFWKFTDENGNRTPPPKLRYFGKPTSLPRQQHRAKSTSCGRRGSTRMASSTSTKTAR